MSDEDNDMLEIEERKPFRGRSEGGHEANNAPKCF